jgi:hypothetical protein
MVDLRLVEEVDEIKDTVSLLTQQLNEAEVARANLLQAALLTPEDVLKCRLCLFVKHELYLGRAMEELGPSFILNPGRYFKMSSLLVW